MNLSPDVVALGHLLAGAFENGDQAREEPAWYVPLRLWQRPIPLFREDSWTLYLEQSNLLKLDQPYRPRVLRITEHPSQPDALLGRYYQLRDAAAVRGGGQDPERLRSLCADDLVDLPGCGLTIAIARSPQGPYFQASLPPEGRCCFTVEGSLRQVSLGFEVGTTAEGSVEFLSYDKGIDPETGRAIWGALMGPFRFHKVESYGEP